MRPLRLALPWIFAAALVGLAACGNSDKTEDGAEASLNEGFLNTLDDANVRYDVLTACHYLRNDNGAWHFSVHITIHADMATTTSALAPTVDIIDDRRPAATVQQFRGQPDKGWTGQLTDNGDATTLDPVKNNIDIANGERPAVGWLPICPESIPS